MVRVIRVGLEYDGTRYHGFGLQPGLLTIQGVVEDALASILGHAVRVTAGGRTDAGVHARGQVVSLRTESRLPAAIVRRALNARLPDDVLATHGVEEAPHFDARRSAVLRSYRYVIWRGDNPNIWCRRYSTHVPGPLRENELSAAAMTLLGQRDFTSFIGHAAQEQEPPRAVRTLTHAEWTREGSYLRFDCRADGFARHMVRNLVGTMLLVGRGKLDVDGFGAVLEARNRQAAGPTAPARGLTLMGVQYADDQENQT